MSAPTGRFGRKLALAGLVLLVAFSGTGYAWFHVRMTAPASSVHGPVEVVLKDGVTFDGALEILTYYGFFTWSGPTTGLVSLRARLRGKRVPIKAGLYKLDMQLTPDALIDRLAGGPDVALKDLPVVFRVDPGQNVFQIANHVSSCGDLRSDRFLDLAKDEPFARQLGLPLPDELQRGTHTALEGYLYPDSYYLGRDRSDVKVGIERATAKFRRVWDKLKVKHPAGYLRATTELKLDDHALVTLASLVQREMCACDEAPMIAGVFYNRLSRGQRLQTDPTLTYSPEAWREVPSRKHRRDASNPYNTYVIKGLPPGPIANPGREALEAVLAPAETNALYFVARRDGSCRHVFAETFDEHKKNIAKHLKGEKAPEPEPQ